jgi:hypothetical protein
MHVIKSFFEINGICFEPAKGNDNTLFEAESQGSHLLIKDNKLTKRGGSCL